jgi:hypothetical protein
MVMHRGALIELPPQGNDAVTHNCPEVNEGKVTDTFGVPLLSITAPGTENVQL